MTKNGTAILGALRTLDKRKTYKNQFKDGTTVAEIAAATGLTLDQVRYGVRQLQYAGKVATRARSYTMPNSASTADLFFKITKTRS